MVYMAARQLFTLTSGDSLVANSAEPLLGPQPSGTATPRRPSAEPHACSRTRARRALETIYIAHPRALHFAEQAVIMENVSTSKQAAITFPKVVQAHATATGAAEGRGGCTSTGRGSSIAHAVLGTESTGRDVTAVRWQPL